VNQFVLTRLAERDLDQIKRYLIEKAGPTITRKVFQEIRSAFELLGREPGAGHLREDLTSRPGEILARPFLHNRLRSRDQAS
jgi:plasmid stabilization system protein ParE